MSHNSSEDLHEPFLHHLFAAQTSLFFSKLMLFLKFNEKKKKNLVKKMLTQMKEALLCLLGSTRLGFLYLKG